MSIYYRYLCTVQMCDCMRIDLREIIRKKTGKRFPKWLIAPLERLIHQRELNNMLVEGAGLSHSEFLRYVLDTLGVDCQAIFTTPLADDQRYIFASNHPFGGLDGMMIINELQKRWGDAGAIVNDLLMAVEPLSPFWVPVNKFGRQKNTTFQAYDAALSSPTKQILTFPAGFCSRVIDGKVQDTEWKSHFIKDAVRYNRQIVPVYVEGQLSKRFYNIYRFRQFFNIKVNLELVLLVDEMFRQKGKRVRIVFGAPIDVNSLEGTAAEKTLKLREESYKLQQLLSNENDN